MDEVMQLHRQAIDLYGGSHGIRDYGLLETAVMAPMQSFGGAFLYDSIERMAAALWHGLVQNHPFIDGNKRIGLRAADVFLARNDLDLNITSAEATEWTLELATGELSRDALAV